MPKHNYSSLPLDGLVSKGFTGSGKKKFIHPGKKVFKDEATGVAGAKIAEGRRGGAKKQSDGGVPRETGYRNRKGPEYKAAPGAI